MVYVPKLKNTKIAHTSFLVTLVASFGWLLDDLPKTMVIYICSEGNLPHWGCSCWLEMTKVRQFPWSMKNNGDPITNHRAETSKRFVHEFRVDYFHSKFIHNFVNISLRLTKSTYNITFRMFVFLYLGTHPTGGF